MTKPKEVPAPEMLRVRFDAQPSAVFIAGDILIAGGQEGELPAEVARKSAANPVMGIVLLDEQLTPAQPSDDLPGVEAHVEPADSGGDSVKKET